MLCGRSAMRTIRSFNGSGRFRISPRFRTRAESRAACGLGKHGAGGCSARLMLLNIIKPSIIANQLEITVSVFMLLITLRLTNCFILLIPFLRVIPLADKSKSNVQSPFLTQAPTVHAVFFSFARTLQIWTLRFARILLIGSLTATSARAHVYAGVLG